MTNSSIAFEFRTWIDQPGRDLTATAQFSQDAGNLKDPSLDWDYSEEITATYAGGRGEREERNIQQAYDSSRAGASIYNRRERFVQATDQVDDDGVLAAAESALWSGRPLLRFTGDALDTSDLVFQKNWDQGDRVSATFEGLTFTPIVRSAAIRLVAGEETIDTRLSSTVAL